PPSHLAARSIPPLFSTTRPPPRSTLFPYTTLFRSDVQEPQLDLDVRALREGQGARGERREALRRLSRAADDRRGRRTGLRGGDLDRGDRTGRPSAADRAQAQRFDQSGDREPGVSRALQADRRRAD